MMKKITYNLLFFLLTVVSSAQQTPVLSDYHYNKLILNPAYSGYHQNPEAVLSGRTFLSGVEGSPRTINFAFHGPINNKKLGVGGMVTHDNIGVTSKTGIYGTYAFKLQMDYTDYPSDWYYSPQVLSFGLIGGVSFYKEDLLSLNMSNDPNFQNNVNATIPSIGVGIYYNVRHFYIGFSAPNLLEPSISKENNIDVRSNYYFNTGYRFYASRYFYIEPGVLLKYTNGAPVQLDMNLVFNYFNKVEFGVGYRTTSTMNLLAGFYLSDNWRMIYNFSPSLNNSPLGQTHGIILSYRFGDGFSNRLD